MNGHNVMEIYINGEKLDFQLGQEEFLGEVFTSLTEWAGQGGKRVWNLSIDYKAYNVSQTVQFEKLKIKDIGRLDVIIGASDPAQEIKARIGLYAAELTRAQETIESIVESYYTEKAAVFMEQWSGVLDLLMRFIRDLPYLAAILRKDNSGFMEKAGQLQAVVQKIYASLQYKDNVAFCDQLQYELKPHLNEWLSFLHDAQKAL